MPIDTRLNPETLFGELQANWGWLLALGIGSLLLGMVGLGSCFAFTLAGVLVFGWLILIAGFVELIQVFKCRGWKSRIWQLVLAVLHILAGGVVIADPLLASASSRSFSPSRSSRAAVRASSWPSSTAASPAGSGAWWAASRPSCSAP